MTDAATTPGTRLARVALVIGLAAAAMMIVSMILMFVTGQPGLQSDISDNFEFTGYFLGALGAALAIVGLVKSRSTLAIVALLISTLGIALLALIELILFFSQLD